MTQRKRPSSSQSSSQRQSGASLLATQDDDTCFTLPSSSQVVRGLDSMTDAQVEQKTAEVVQYFLVRDQKKVPVRRADIVKHVMKEHRNVYPEILRRATHTLQQVFGLKLLEIDAKNHLYILVNGLPPAAGRSPISSAPSSPKSGLLFVILGLIFMKGGSVRENVVWTTLKKLRVDPGEKHEEFGDVKKLITDEFVRQRYLEYTRVPHTEPVEHTLEWGLRANAEVSKVKILEFMAELHGLDAQTWSQQYREAHAEPASSSQASSSSSSSSRQR